MNIESPPLRDRRDDIPLLIHYFKNKYSFEFKKECLDIPPSVFDIFLSYRWPGNVRELENMIKRAIAMRDWTFVYSEIDTDAVDANEETYADPNKVSTGLNWDNDRIKKLFEENDYSLKKITKTFVSEAEREMILKTLEEHRWNRTKAAKVLNTSYRTLLSRIEEFGLKK
jgi:transcriptional regulator with PAS, ATPase and Fis domain